MNSRILSLMFAGVLSLYGCAADSDHASIIDSVNVLVPVHCKPDLGPDPDYYDSDEALMRVPYPNAEIALKLNPLDPELQRQVAVNHRMRDGMYAGGRLQRIAREQTLKAALKGCAGIDDTAGEPPNEQPTSQPR